MTYCKSLCLSLAMASASFVALPVQALTISYGGQAATDGSGLTSNFVPASNTGLGAGYFIETFDLATGGLPTSLLSPGNGSDISVAGAGCSVNFYGLLGTSTTGGGFGVQQGSTPGVAAAPAGDETCFGFGPRPGGTLPATVKVDYSNLLGPGVKISYLGLYYGSIDTYNDINIYNGDTLLQTITGASVLAAGGGQSGNQTQPGSNVYVNFAFDAGEAFTAFEFVTTSVAFEVDNIVVGLDNRPNNNVPEPGSLALFAAGLLGFAATRRMRKG